ncbi:hypothetical protein D3C75_1174810 [compost metagenome]
MMEKKHASKLKQKFPDKLAAKRLVCLDIPDDYTYMDEDLIEILKSRVSEYMEVPD